MSKRRGAHDRKRLDPEDVLAGRVKVGAAELLDLIHHVNPTGRELGAREAEVRYAQKARLQSLLVRRFGPELEVVLDPASEGTVSIVHARHGRDGCHAVVDALDEDARAWVRLQLDLGPPSSEAPSHLPTRPAPPPDGDRSPSSADASPESLVGRADDALAAYDYERARAYLVRALAASDGAARPAAALLALLVETLGDDAGALALQPSLSRSALAHPDVRARLALAAARCGDAVQATALLSGAGEQKAAEVSAVLAFRAVGEEDAEQAAAHLADLKRRDPAHPDIVRLSDEIARLRAVARRPFEAELASLVAASRDGEAEDKAAEVLARWPESEVARRIVRAAEERRRLAQEATAARARELDAAREAQREAAQVELVQELLAEADPREGLLAWLDLDPALRRRVGGPGTAELRRWLDLTPARAAPLARVEAVLALASARGRLAGDPQGAIDALAPNEATLERVPEARRIMQGARAEIAARRSARACEEVLAARGDLAGGDASAALSRLDPSVLRDLDDEERAAAEAVRAEAARLVTRDKRVADVGRLRRAGNLFEARALAGELRAEAPPEERPRWEEERQAIQEEIQRAFHVEIDREPSPLDGEPGPEATQPMMEAPVWLTEDGRTLVLAAGKERWVWVQLVDVDSRTVRAQMVLRAPEPVGTVIARVLGHTAWLTSVRGGLLAIDVERLSVELFRPAREIVAPGRHVGGVAIAADRGARDARYYWVQPADEDGYACPVQVIDLETRRVVREIPEVIRLAGIPGTREARVGCFKAAGLVLHEERGVPVPGGRFPRLDVAVVLAAVHPSGDGLVVAGSLSPSPWHVIRHPAPGSRRKPEAPESEDHHRYVLVDLAASGPARAPWFVGAEDIGTVLELGSSLDTGLCALMSVRADLRWELLVVRPTGGTFELLHRSEVPQYTAIVRDAGARHLFVYSARPSALAPIGPTAPELPRGTMHPSPWIGDVSGARACLGSAGARAEAYQAVKESLSREPLEAIATNSRNLQRENDPEKIVERARALAGHDIPAADADARRLADWLWERHRDSPRVRMLRADELATLGRWAEVREVLAPCTSASDAGDEDHAQHFSHLLALAALHLGEVEEARRRAGEAAEHGGSCQLHGLAAVLAPEPAPPVRAGAGEMEAPPLLTQVVWAIHAADAHLAGGDPESALAALDPERFDTGDEVQVLARRAEAWLALSPPPGRRRFVKIMTLAALLDAHRGEPDEERDELPVPGATWDRARLDDVVTRAAAWLEAHCAE
jgi:hypothetical protein